MAAYPVFVYVVYRAGRQVGPLASLHEIQRTQIQDMLPQQYYNEKVHILTRDFSQELYVPPDDDKRYAIETCRSSGSVFKKAI